MTLIFDRLWWIIIFIFCDCFLQTFNQSTIDCCVFFLESRYVLQVEEVQRCSRRCDGQLNYTREGLMHRHHIAITSSLPHQKVMVDCYVSSR